MYSVLSALTWRLMPAVARSRLCSWEGRVYLPKALCHRRCPRPSLFERGIFCFFPLSACVELRLVPRDFRYSRSIKDSVSLKQREVISERSLSVVRPSSDVTPTARDLYLSDCTISVNISFSLCMFSLPRYCSLKLLSFILSIDVLST